MIPMDAPELFIFLLLLGTICITGGVILVLSSQLKKRGAAWLLCTTAAMTGWLCCDALIIAVPDISVKFALSTAKFVCVILIPLMFFFFTLAYTGRETTITAWKRTLLSLIPGAGICIILTNSLTGLFYTPLSDPSLWVYNHFTGPQGIWYWVNLVYSYALITVSLLLLISLFMSSPQHFRRQIVLLILSVLAPFTANCIVVFTHVGTETADITPLFFSLSGIFLFIAAFWLDLFSIVPFARTRIVTEIHEGVIVADEHGVIVDINSAACKATGIPEKDAISLSADTLLSTIFGITLAELSEVRTLTVSHTNTAGVVRWSDLTLSAVEGYNTRSGGTIILISDATTRRRAEEEITAKDLRLKIAMDGAGLASWEWREGEGYITYENPLADRAIEHVTSIEAMIEQMRQCLLDGSETTPDDPFTDILCGDVDTFSVEFPIGIPKEVRWIQITGRVIERDTEKRPIWMVGITHDVSSSYAARAALMEANTKIKLLTSITRHDVLNQVMAIRMLIELAGMEPEDAMNPEVREIVTKIDTAAAMIEDQISFTRDYEDLGTYTPSWQNVANVAAQAIGIVSETGITYSCSTATLEIYADPMFRKVMENLFENARRHGGGVTALTVRFEEDGDRGRLVVEDNGRGVPEKLKTRIFSQGFGQNTGFGLFLSKEILALTAITISEEGREGEGARFVMHIPAGRYRGHPARM